ncbi:hypothetical protein X975_05379, partial [Stegodyphus mimosarum]
MVVLLAGDFRQTLPVIQVQFHNDVDSGIYAEKLLKIGDGCLERDAEGCVLLSEELCNFVENDVELIAKVYPHLQENLNSDHCLCARAIVAPTNEIVNKINIDILKEVQEEIKEYLSIDTIMDTEQSSSYSAEFLNSLELSDVPHMNSN